MTAQVETLLKKNQPGAEPQEESTSAATDAAVETNLKPEELTATHGTSSFSPPSRHCMSDEPQTQARQGGAFTYTKPKPGELLDDSFSWEMVELGLDEPLPLRETLEDLTQIYFAHVHPTVPIIHQYRFLAALDLSPTTRPPIALRYAMWTLAASVTNRYQLLHEHFYARARKYAELAEMSGHGEKVTSVAQTQAWILLGIYELKMMFFPRTWLSTGRAVRLAQMMGMHRLDGPNYDLKHILLPPRDWVEKEERRRTFWMAFCMDRSAAIGTGWPMAIEEEDIHTNLPCSEEEYEQCQETPTMSLEDAMRPPHTARLSSFAGAVVVTALFGRVLLHVHRLTRDDRYGDINGKFWKRHQNMDNMLLSTALHLPPHLRLPVVSPEPNTIYLHMSLHAASISLHQVALFKAETYRLSSDLIAESLGRCFAAAAEITRIMKMIAHTNLAVMNPFLPFCVFVAARVFIQHVKSRPNDHDPTSSVQFLLSAMVVLQTMNPLAASFLVQLNIELEGTGLEGHPDNARYQPPFDVRTTELDKNEVDGFIVDSGTPATSPSQNSNVSSEERKREHPRYQYLPLRNVAVSNYGESKHREFQTKQSMGPDASSNLPVLGFDEIISSSTSEMDVASEGIIQSEDAAIPHYTGTPLHPSSQVSGDSFPGVTPHIQFGGHEKLGAHASSYASTSQPYMSQAPVLEDAMYVPEETWDFNDMDTQNDLYELMMNSGTTGPDTTSNK